MFVIKRLGLMIGAFFFLNSSPVWAQLSTGQSDYSQGYILKTVPLGFGGAYRALADTNAAILYNPAGLAQRKGIVAVSGDYLFNRFTDSNAFSISAADYKTTDFLVMALEYDRDVFTVGGNGVTAQQITVAAAKEFGSIVFVGLALKGFISSVKSPFLGGPDGIDADLGVLVKPIPLVSFALTAQNLVQGSRFEEFPLQIGFGTALNLAPHGRLAIDIVRDFKTPAPNTVNAFFGGELRLTEGFFLRSGFGLDRIRNNNFYSVALAAIGPKAGFNFTFSQRLNPTAETYGGNLEFYF